MQRCKFCRIDLPAQARFCPNCGELVSGKEPEESNNFPMTLQQLGFAPPATPHDATPRRQNFMAQNNQKFSDKKLQGNLSVKMPLVLCPKWLLVLIALLIFGAGSIGTLTAMLHIPLPFTGHLPHTTSIAQATPTRKKSEPPLISSSSTPCPDDIGNTGSALNGQIQLTFSGAISGQMQVSRFLFSCGLIQNTQKLQYTLTGCGNIDSQAYSYVIDIVPYTGPGTYNTLTDIGITTLVTPNDTCGSVFIRHDWNEQNGTITIMKDEKSGTFHCLLQNAVTPTPTPTPTSTLDSTPTTDLTPTTPADNTLQITGSWILH